MSVESQRQPDPNPNQDYINDLSNDRSLDYLLDAIEHETIAINNINRFNIPIPEIELNPHCCEHFPNRITLIHSEDYNGFRFSVYECQDCGKEIDFINKIDQLR